MSAGFRRRAMLVLAIVCAASGLGGRATADLPAAAVEDDGVPSGTVTFFDPAVGGCPAGWTAATEVAGRLVVGVTSIDAVGLQVGVPLGDQEDRVHSHPYASVVQLPSKNIAAANGGNHSGAAAGDHMLSASTDGATSGLPFVQLVVCAKP